MRKRRQRLRPPRQVTCFPSRARFGAFPSAQSLRPASTGADFRARGAANYVSPSSTSRPDTRFPWSGHYDPTPHRLTLTCPSLGPCAVIAEEDEYIKIPKVVFTNGLDKMLDEMARPPTRRHAGTHLRASKVVTFPEEIWARSSRRSIALIVAHR
jgi:hypothetical protein